MSNKKIDIIVGARPNFIKAFPVYRALEKTGSIRLKLINTGQHYDKNMSALFFDQMQMKEPDINLGIGSGNHGEQTGRILIELEKVFINDRPDLVIVFGDVHSTFAAALAAKKLCIAVAHIEAGLRSFDRNMPEEINRLLTDQISDYLFITSKEAKNNLLNEGKIVEQIHFVGNTMIDSLLQFNNKFNCEVGLSDHTKGIGAAVASVAVGASIIEKHIVLKKNDGSVDEDFSLDPLEFKNLVKEANNAWLALGKKNLVPTKNEKKTSVLRRSVYVVKDLKKGDVLSHENIKVIRPGYGLHPKYFNKLIGKKLRKTVKKGTPFKKGMA